MSAALASIVSEDQLEAVFCGLDRLGHRSLREPQERVLRHIFAGDDCVAVLPTGAGKSLLYQLPAVCREGLVVVVSPLIALMIDQVGKMQAKGISAHALTSHSSAGERRAAMDALQDGSCQLLYVSPERLLRTDPRGFGKCEVQLVAVDEAHCISEWGHDFRPAYRSIGRELSRIFHRRPQLLALTATATEQVAVDVGKVLGLRAGHAPLVRYGPDRPNVFFAIAGALVSPTRLVTRCGVPALVYGVTRRGVDQAAEELRRSGYKTASYHAGMKKSERREVQEQFARGELDVVCATCAFGMGVDVTVRSVIHLEIPTSIEQYVQEAGRAGRDGEPAMAVCRATTDSLEVARSLIPLQWPHPDRVLFFWEQFKELVSNPGVIARHRGLGLALGLLQATHQEIGEVVDLDPLAVGSALRILSDAGNLRILSAQDRPVVVSLLSGSSYRPRVGERLEVLERLEAHADAQGDVRGSEAWFGSVIGLDRELATALRDHGALRFSWSDRTTIYEILDDGPAKFDTAVVHAVRRRAEQRLNAARDYLSNEVECLRAYLLSYFGDGSGGAYTAACCSRCRRGM